MLENRRVYLIILSALFLLYIAARLWRLDEACLWFDEIFSVHAAGQEWNSLFSFVAKDLIHPPLFYVLLKAWIAIGGDSLFWLRLFPVLFAGLALVPFLFLCRELKQKRSTILLAVFLLAVNGSLINYSQRVRMYTLLMFLSLISIWLFARYFNRGKSLISLLIINVFLVYTHYYGLLVVGCEIGAILFFQRIKWRGAAALFGTTAVAFLPWLYAILTASRRGSELSQNIAWILRPGLNELGIFIIDLVEPFYFQFSTTEPTSIFVVSIPILLIFLVAIVLYFVNLRKFESSEKQTALFLAIFAIVPILLVLIASWILPYSVWGARHLIICAGPLALLMANMVMRLDPRIVRISAITLIFLFSTLGLFLQATRPASAYLWCAWDRIGTEFAASEPKDPPEKIYAFESLIAYHVWFATRNAGNTQVFDVEGFDPMKENEVYFLPRGFDGVQKATINDINDERAWLLFRTHKFGEETPLMESLRLKGYSICPATPIRYGTTNVFKIEIVKPPTVCSE